jgi:hypothetical protein
MILLPQAANHTSHPEGHRAIGIFLRLRDSGDHFLAIEAISRVVCITHWSSLGIPQRQICSNSTNIPTQTDKNEEGMTYIQGKGRYSQWSINTMNSEATSFTKATK